MAKGAAMVKSPSSQPATPLPGYWILVLFGGGSNEEVRTAASGAALLLAFEWFVCAHCVGVDSAVCRVGINLSAHGLDMR
jgi:hypothetical protein